MYPKGDIKALAGYIELMQDPKRREVMGRNVQKSVKEHFPLEKMIQAYASLLHNLAE